MFDGTFDGTWVNERGSGMILKQRDEAISGHYRTQIGNDTVARREHAIVGLANGTTIGFVVSWPAALSLTAGRAASTSIRKVSSGFIRSGILSGQYRTPTHRKTSRCGRAS